MNLECAVGGCGLAERLITGLCSRHYQRQAKHGSAEAEGVEVRARNPSVCIAADCLGKPKAKGLCNRHYQRLRKYGDPSFIKYRDTNPYQPRACLRCAVDISHMKTNALFCSRTCKTVSGDQQRRVDENGRSRERERGRARYIKERDRRIVAAKSYYYRTQPRRLETAKQWRESNRDLRVAQHNNRRARKFGNPGYVGVSGREWRMALGRAGGKCSYCCRPGKLVMDHVVPLARGGRHAPGNVTPACVSCNSSKSDLFVSEWRHGKLPPVRIRTLRELQRIQPSVPGRGYLDDPKTTRRLECEILEGSAQ